MNTITAAEAKTLLLTCESENAARLEEIDFITRNNIEVKYLTVGGALIIAQVFRGEPFTTVCPLSADWNMDEIVTYLRESVKGSVLIDVQKLDSETKAELITRLSETFMYKKTYSDYVLSTTRDLPADPSIRPLTPDDRDVFLAMEYTAEQYRPPLNILFDSYVIHKVEDGNILACFENGTVIGYLSYVHQTGAYYDVDYVWVAPSRRKEGIGNRLAAAYIREIQSNGGVPMWSNPKNEISMRLAVKYGFTLNRETLCFE